MRPLHLGRLTLAALLVLSCALTALSSGCAVSTFAPTLRAPLAVRPNDGAVTTQSVEPSSAAGATESDTASASPSDSSSVAASEAVATSDSVAASAPPKPYAAPLRPPIAGLPQPKPMTEITGPRNLAVPVLMYHVIGIAPANARNPDLYVTPGEFVAQMRYLSKHGYHAVTLQQVYGFWHNGGTLPDKPIVLSFDDGTMPDFTIVAPLLNELQWPGVMNLIIGRHKLRFRKPLIRALINAGWEIDSHTITHEEVPGLSAKQLALEIGGSRKRLQKMYHVPVNFFCYPSGAYDDAAVAAVKKAGYLGATTTTGGLARRDEPYLMRRVRVSGGLSVESFAALLKQYH